MRLEELTVEQLMEVLRQLYILEKQIKDAIRNHD
jgi:hypothetical protein